jgi:hypothetical protein
MNENESLKNSEPAPPAPDGYVSVQTVLEALYSAILRREITGHELEQRLESIQNLDKNQLTQLVRSFMLSPEFAQKFEELAAEQPLFQKYSISHTSTKLRAVAIVAVVDEVWLPFCLAIADYLAEEYSLQTLLVTYSPFQRAYDAELLSPAVVSCIHIQDLFKLADSFEPHLLVAHSFGWHGLTEELLQTYPYAPLIVFGDSYKNSLSTDFDNIRPIHKVILFGFDDNSYPSVSRVVIESKTISYYRKRISGFYPFSSLVQENEPENYSVLYLRYWGSGPYSTLSAEKILKIWILTVLPNLPAGETLIIKNDPRVDMSLYRGAVESFREVGVDVLMFEDYLELIGCSDNSLGLLPVEFFFLNGFLCRSKSHFVLDSALSYSLSVQPLLVRPSRLYLGADDTLLSRDSESVAIDNIEFGVNLYSYGLLNSHEIEKVEELPQQGSLLRCFELKN